NSYHYANLSNKFQAHSEANYLLTVLQNRGINNKINIFPDIEGSSTQNDNAAGKLNAFWHGVRNEDHSNDGVYTYTNYLYRSAVVNTVGEKQTWVVHYPYQPSANNLLHSEFDGWQFSQTARIPGSSYTGDLDVSHDYKGLLNDGAGSDPF